MAQLFLRDRTKVDIPDERYDFIETAFKAFTDDKKDQMIELPTGAIKASQIAKMSRLGGIRKSSGYASYTPKQCEVLIHSYLTTKDEPFYEKQIKVMEDLINSDEYFVLSPTTRDKILEAREKKLTPLQARDVAVEIVDSGTVGKLRRERLLDFYEDQLVIERTEHDYIVLDPKKLSQLQTMIKNWELNQAQTEYAKNETKKILEKGRGVVSETLFTNQE